MENVPSPIFDKEEKEEAEVEAIQISTDTDTHALHTPSGLQSIERNSRTDVSAEQHVPNGFENLSLCAPTATTLDAIRMIIDSSPSSHDEECISSEVNVLIENTGPWVIDSKNEAKLFVKWMRICHLVIAIRFWSTSWMTKLPSLLCYSFHYVYITRTYARCSQPQVFHSSFLFLILKLL